MLSRLSCLLVLVLAGCSSELLEDDPTMTGDDANVTSTTAERLNIPLEVLNATFFIKPSPIDQSILGVVLADGVAFADGATGSALPKVTTLGNAPFAKLPTGVVTVGEERYGAMFDSKGLDVGTGERLNERPTAPILAASKVAAKMTCHVVGPAMDMYASGAPILTSLEGTIDHVRDGLVLVKTEQSTGGDMSLLVCNDKLAGIRAGAGSQGTYHEFHVLDRQTLDAFKAKRDACAHGCR